MSKRTNMTSATKPHLRGMKRNWAGQPLHHRVRERIIQDLMRSGIAAGARYCTEMELAVRLRVSRNTVRKAMAELEREGYVSRRRRVGTIVGNRFASSRHAASAPVAPPRSRVVFVLPEWDDTVEGFYAGRLLRELCSPRLSPPLAVEVRHHDDPIERESVEGAAIVAADPDPRMVLHLRDLCLRGVRVIVTEPCQLMPGLVGLYTDHRPVVRDAVKKFHALGHRAVGLMNHDQMHLGFQRCFLGYLDAHREMDIPIHPKGIVQETKHEAAGQALDVKNISAWICTYIHSVNLVAQECQRAGLSVPEDVSILSLDDPGDVPVASLGKRVSVARTDVAAGAAMIHECLMNWRPDRIGTLTAIPSVWIDRETIAPPCTHAIRRG